jgi:hypothetical protein
LTISTVTKAQHGAYDVRRWLRRKYHLLLRQAQKLNDSVSRDPRRWVTAGVLVLLTIILVWHLPRIMTIVRWQAISRHPKKSPQTAASIWYSRMLKNVARRGYHKAPHQTPNEFVKVIPEPHLRDAVSRFTDRYERARFGDSAPDAEQLPQLYEDIVAKQP